MYNKAKLRKLQNAYRAAKENHEFILKQDKEIKTKILSENEFFISQEWEELAGQRILDPIGDYEMNDSDFEKYCHLVYAEALKRGLPARDWETTLDYQTRPALKEAENNLLDYSLEFTVNAKPELTSKVLAEMVNDFDTRIKMIELVMQLA